MTRPRTPLRGVRYNGGITAARGFTTRRDRTDLGTAALSDRTALKGLRERALVVRFSREIYSNRRKGAIF